MECVDSIQQYAPKAASYNLNKQSGHNRYDLLKRNVDTQINIHSSSISFFIFCQLEDVFINLILSCYIHV